MTYRSIFILGRQPAIGRAELESLFGAKHLEPIGEQAMGCDLDVSQIPFRRLGGSIRLAKTLNVLPTTNWSDVQKYLVKELPKHLGYLPEGKLKLGLSAFGLDVGPAALLKTGLELKRVCRKAGRSARVVPNESLELNSAQVIHNQLTGKLGMELLFIKQNDQTWLAQTAAVQDIEAYARRDQQRPKRDPRVGMLPPKLAQIIINLAVGDMLSAISNQSSVPTTDNRQLTTTKPKVLLDPFCGTGVLLQEALLMGYGVYGTDIDPRMVDYTKQNLDWLEHTQHPLSNIQHLEIADATSHRWPQPFSVVASEAYLGQPLAVWPSEPNLKEIVNSCNVIIERFLSNLADQSQPGLRLCLAVPAWVSPSGQFRRLPLLDHLKELGYNRFSFEHARDEDLIYSRPGQLVARELLTIIRK